MPAREGAWSALLGAREVELPGQGGQAGSAFRSSALDGLDYLKGYFDKETQ